MRHGDGGTTPARHRTGSTLLRLPVAVALGTGVAAGILAALLVGRPGVVAAALGIGLVLAFLLVGQLPVAAAARGRRQVGTALLIGGYTLRVWLVLVAFGLFRDADGVDRDVLGLTVVAVALGWTAGAVWSLLRWRPMVVEPEPPR